MEDAILPAGFFAMWATRRMHERGTKPEHLAKIAAKNWNNGAMNPMAQRQPKEPVTAEKVLQLAHGGVAADDDDVVPDRRRRRLRDRRHASSWRRSCSPDRPVVRVAASTLQSERYERGHLFQGPVVGPARMTVDTSQRRLRAGGRRPARTSTSSRCTTPSPSRSSSTTSCSASVSRARPRRASSAATSSSAAAAGVDRRRPDRARPPGRPDRPGADLGDHAAAARRGRQAPGREGQEGARRASASAT